jgi:hypothetical protein
MAKEMRVIFAVLICMVLGISFAWALDLKEGQYQITSKVEMPGMPMSMPPVTVEQCLTRKDPVPNQSTGGQECRIKDMKTKGNTVTWTMECTQRGSTMQGTGSMTFHGDRFEGKSEMKMGPEAGNMVIITLMEGRRTGPCQ